MKHIAWILLALCAGARAADCDLDCSLERELREQGLAGAVYTLVDGDEIRLGAVGLANEELHQPLRADSKVHVGSVAKTMLALGILRLATQGRVNLDAPLSGLLPQVALDNPWHRTRPVTLRHLLDHTAGLEDLRLWHLFTLRATPHAPLQGALENAPGLLRVRTEPGTQFSYSNIGYTLAGMVIESVTGERYESWLDRELLHPLGMNDSTFEFVSQRGESADRRLAWGHYDDLGLAVAQPVWPRPATQFTTTAGDMARVARLLMSDGRIGEETFIDETLLLQMGKARTAAAGAGLEVGYALGISIRDRHGAAGLCHTGSVVGFRAALCVFREQRKAYFISINSDKESAQYPRFDELMTRTLNVSTDTVPRAEGHPAPVDWQGRYVAYPARFERFRYFDLLLDSVSLRVNGADVELHRLGAQPQILEAVGTRLYRAGDRSLASHVMLIEGEGKVISDGARTLRKIGPMQFALTWLSLALGVTGIVALLVLIPWRSWRHGEPLLQPATLALLLVLLPLVLLMRQPFMALGDMTITNMIVYASTLALPLLMVAQVIWAWRWRVRLRSWRVHLLAAVFVLQWCGSLYAWDLLPFATWA